MRSKGVVDFVLAARNTIAKGYNAKFFIAGEWWGQEPDLEGEVKKLIQDNYLTNNIDLTTGDEHWSGALFRLTIPGIGHVLLDMGTWFWDASAETLVHHGPSYALAEGETGLALCEALE